MTAGSMTLAMVPVTAWAAAQSKIGAVPRQAPPASSVWLASSRPVRSAGLAGTLPATGQPMTVAGPVVNPALSDQESLTPALTATPTGASGTLTTHFYARRVGDSSWTLVNNATKTGVAGQLVFVQIPANQLSPGDGIEWQAQTCTSTSVCTTSALQTGYASPAVGAGDINGATFLSRSLSDVVGVKVNVGTGNLLVETHELALPGVSGDLQMSNAFNSAYLAPGARQTTGSTGKGWRLPNAGPDFQLVKNPTGSVSLFGPSGQVDLFRPTAPGSTNYTSVDGQKHTLDYLGGPDPNVPGSPSASYRLTEHASGMRYYFNTALQLVAAYDRHQQKTSYSYDANGHLTQVVSSRGGAGANTATFTYSASNPGLIGSVTQSTATGPATSRTWTYGYDAGNHLASITDPAGQQTDFGYTGDDLTSITTAGGSQTTFTYDAKHRVTSFTQRNSSWPGDSTTRLDYTDGTHTLVADANTDSGQPVSAVPHAQYWLTGADGSMDHMGRTRRYLDADNTDLANPTRAYTYTPFGDYATITDAYGHQTSNAWTNSSESLSSTTLATGAVSSNAYANVNTATNPTALYEPSSSTDPDGHTKTYSYDTYGSVAFVQDASSNKAQVTYHTDGTVASSTDPGNGSNATTYTENTSTHQLTGLTPVTGSSLRARSFTYDGFGRIATATTGALDSGGHEITLTYSYDQAPSGGIGRLDRVASISYSDGTATVSYTYTDDGQVATRTVGSVTTTYDYDALGRQTSVVTSGGGGTLDYYYDQAGNLVETVDGRGDTDYDYDPAERLVSMSDAFGHVTDFVNDKNRQRTDTWFATNTAHTSWTAHTHLTFDNAGRLQEIKTTRDSSDTSAGDIVSDLTYSYTAPGPTVCAGSPAAGKDTNTRWAVTDATDPANPTTTKYCYDKSNRLTDANPVAGHHYAYGYDANGNTTSVTVDGTTTSYPANPANQIAKAGYSYDGAGNLTATPTAPLLYNGANQTTKYNGSHADYAGPDQVERTHTFDGLDWVYGRAPTSGPLQGQPLAADWITSNGPAWIDRDPDGVPIELTFTGTSYYYVRDGLGSIIALVSANDQDVAASYTYDPYGGLITGGTSGMGYTNRLRYTGGEYDRFSGYTHLGARYYDPTTTKFTQPDSLNRLADPTNGNLYQYADANPCNNVDPSGRFSISCFVKSFFPGVGGGDLILGGLGGASVGLVALRAGIVGLEGAAATAAGIFSGGILIAGGIALAVGGGIEVANECG
ncbi:MAG TPA: RHS repeat-associated core domain-containing protein [Nocardioidaceae bacterium]|nr:RHS repeat-associated core domain-containing protein [Nocardioidaceae bacterium]